MIITSIFENASLRIFIPLISILDVTIWHIIKLNVAEENNAIPISCKFLNIFLLLINIINTISIINTIIHNLFNFYILFSKLIYNLFI